MNWVYTNVRFPTSCCVLPTEDQCDNDGSRKVRNGWAASQEAPLMWYHLLLSWLVMQKKQVCGERRCEPMVPHFCLEGGTRWFRGNCRRVVDRAPCSWCSCGNSPHPPVRTQKKYTVCEHSPEWPMRPDCSLLQCSALQKRRSYSSAPAVITELGQAVKRWVYRTGEKVQELCWWGDNGTWLVGKKPSWTVHSSFLFRSYVQKYNYICPAIPSIKPTWCHQEDHFMLARVRF